MWKDCDPRKAVNVAVDLYFDKKEEKHIRRVLGMTLKTKQRSEAQEKQTAKLTEAGKRNRFSSGKIEDAEKVGVLAVKN